LNVLSIYQITHLGLKNKVNFTLELVVISNLLDGSKIVFNEVNHHSRFHTFSHFNHQYDYISLLTHDNEESKL